eukprot:2807993-Prymnesium_polylepis.1
MSPAARSAVPSTPDWLSCRAGTALDEALETSGRRTRTRPHCALAVARRRSSRPAAAVTAASAAVPLRHVARVRSRMPVTRGFLIRAVPPTSRYVPLRRRSSARLCVMLKCVRCASVGVTSRGSSAGSTSAISRPNVTPSKEQMPTTSVSRLPSLKRRHVRFSSSSCTTVR